MNLIYLRFLTVALALSMAAALAQDSGDHDDKSFDLKSTIGDLHLGSDVDQRQLGVPTYPGARLRKHDDNSSSANLALFTSAFGVKLVVASYDSDDDAAGIIAFYRGKLKRYGKVLECHTSRHGGDVNVNDEHDGSNGSKELRCEGNNTGAVTELKAGTEDNQHVVAVEPAESGKGSTFALVYVYTRGKQGDI